jgi:hypothetical protein
MFFFNFWQSKDIKISSRKKLLCWSHATKLQTPDQCTLHWCVHEDQYLDISFGDNDIYLILIQKISCQLQWVGFKVKELVYHFMALKNSFVVRKLKLTPVWKIWSLLFSVTHWGNRYFFDDDENPLYSRLISSSKFFVRFSSIFFCVKSGWENIDLVFLYKIVVV